MCQISFGPHGGTLRRLCGHGQISFPGQYGHGPLGIHTVDTRAAYIPHGLGEQTGSGSIFRQRERMLGDHLNPSETVTLPTYRHTPSLKCGFSMADGAEGMVKDNGAPTFVLVLLCVQILRALGVQSARPACAPFVARVNPLRCGHSNQG